MFATTGLSLRHLFIAIAIAAMFAVAMFAVAHFGAAGAHHLAVAVNTGEAADKLS